jgi:DNA-binding MarR family transcriptional regulator
MAEMAASAGPPDLRRHRNVALYRSAARILREYNRRLIAGLHERGFDDFMPSFPQILSNLDTEGTRIGILARRAGISRQAAGKLLGQIERSGYVELRPDVRDSRATLVLFTPRGRRMLATVLRIIRSLDRGLASAIGKQTFERVRSELFEIAEEFDPSGALGVDDR